MVDVARLALQIDVNGAQRARSTMEALRSGSIQLTKATDAQIAAQYRLNSSYQAAAASGRRITGAFRLQKGAIQQVGFQVGDFATQVSAGQSAIVAFGQQASQLAGIMGPGGALLGAVIAIGSGIAGAFVRGMGSGAEAASLLSKTLDETSKSLDRAENSTFELTERIREMAQVSHAAARIELNAQLIKIDNAISSVGSSLRNTFGQNGDFESAISMFDQLSRSGESAGAMMTAFESSLRGVDPNLTDEYRFLEGSLSGIRDEFGLTRNQSILFLDALKRINDEPTEENLNLLVGRLNAIQESSESTTPQFALMAGEVSGVATEALKLIERGESLDGILDNLTESLSAAGEGSGESADKIREMVTAAEQQAATLGMSSRAIATYEAALAGANADQILSIDTAYRRIEAYNAEQEAARKAAKEERERALEALKQERELQKIRDQVDPAQALLTATFDKVELINSTVGGTKEAATLIEAVWAEHNARMAEISGDGMADVVTEYDKAADEIIATINRIGQLQGANFQTSFSQLGTVFNDLSDKQIASFSAVGAAFDNVTSLMQQGGKDQFETYKRLAQAQAAVSTAMAVTNALAVPPPPVGIALATTIGALGAVQIAAIEQQQYQPQASFLGGGYTGTGPRSGGVDGKGGFPAILHPNETVIDHTRDGSSGGTSNKVDQTLVFQISGGGDERKMQEAIMKAMPVIREQAKIAVTQGINQGGSLSRAVGRRP